MTKDTPDIRSTELVPEYEKPLSVPRWINPTREGIVRVWGDIIGGWYDDHINGYKDYQGRVHEPVSPSKALEQIYAEGTSTQTAWFRGNALENVIAINPNGARILNIGGSAIEAASFALLTKVTPYTARLETARDMLFELHRTATLFDGIPEDVLPFENFPHPDYIRQIRSVLSQLYGSNGDFIGRFAKRGDLNTYALLRQHSQSGNIEKFIQALQKAVDSVTKIPSTSTADQEIADRFNGYQFTTDTTRPYEMVVVNTNNQEIESGIKNRFPVGKLSYDTPTEQVYSIESGMLRDTGEKYTGTNYLLTGYPLFALDDDRYKLLKFQRRNVLSGLVNDLGVFDSVLIHNVLMHYPPETRRLIIANSVAGLQDKGTFITETYILRGNDGDDTEYYHWKKGSGLSDLGLSKESDTVWRYDESKNRWKGKELKLDNDGLLAVM